MPDSLTGTLETILVVDDQEMVRKSVVAILERAHFKVLSADTGASAIELSARTEGRIDLLLSDVDMPNISGPQLGETLKKPERSSYNAYAGRRKRKFARAELRLVSY
jgi:CheY-like chemotaxis protein